MRQKFYKLIMVFFMALFLTIIRYAVMSCNADDAQGYNWIYQKYELGVQSVDNNMFNPMLLALSALYFLLGDNINGAELCMIYFAFWYFLGIFLTLYLAIRKSKTTNVGWLVIMAAFILLPSDRTNRYHLIPTIASLIILFLVEKFGEEQKKRLLIIAAVLFTYIFLSVNDKSIVLLYTVIPSTVLGIIWCLQKKRHKFLYLGTLACVSVLVVLNLVNTVCVEVLGHELGIVSAFAGYGGEEYLTWIDVYNLFDKGIPSFFSALMSQYNIPVNGGMTQILSVFWILRIFMVGVMLAAWILRLKDIVTKGVANISILDSLSAVTIAVLTLINVLNGIVKGYGDIDGLPINRYNSLAWLLFVIIAVRWIDERYTAINLIHINNKVFSSNCVLGIIFGLLIIGYGKPLHMSEMNKIPCKSEIDFLEQNREIYAYGLSSYWKSFPITAATKVQLINVNREM